MKRFGDFQVVFVAVAAYNFTSPEVRADSIVDMQRWELHPSSDVESHQITLEVADNLKQTHATSPRILEAAPAGLGVRLGAGRVLKRSVR